VFYLTQWAGKSQRHFTCLTKAVRLPGTSSLKVSESRSKVSFLKHGCTLPAFDWCTRSMTQLYVHLVLAGLYCLMLLQTVRCSVTTCTCSHLFVSDGKKIRKCLCCYILCGGLCCEIPDSSARTSNSFLLTRPEQFSFAAIFLRNVYELQTSLLSAHGNRMVKLPTADHWQPRIYAQICQVTSWRNFLQN
jgi:hypothetical protein